MKRPSDHVVIKGSMKRVKPGAEGSVNVAAVKPGAEGSVKVAAVKPGVEGSVKIAAVKSVKVVAVKPSVEGSVKPGLSRSLTSTLTKPSTTPKSRAPFAKPASSEPVRNVLEGNGLGEWVTSFETSLLSPNLTEFFALVRHEQEHVFEKPLLDRFREKNLANFADHKILHAIKTRFFAFVARLNKTFPATTLDQYIQNRHRAMLWIELVSLRFYFVNFFHLQQLPDPMPASLRHWLRSLVDLSSLKQFEAGKSDKDSWQKCIQYLKWEGPLSRFAKQMIVHWFNSWRQEFETLKVDASNVEDKYKEFQTQISLWSELEYWPKTMNWKSVFILQVLNLWSPSSAAQASSSSLESFLTQHIFQQQDKKIFLNVSSGLVHEPGMWLVTAKEIQTQRTEKYFRMMTGQLWWDFDLDKKSNQTTRNEELATKLVRLFETLQPPFHLLKKLDWISFFQKIQLSKQMSQSLQCTRLNTFIHLIQEASTSRLGQIEDAHSNLFEHLIEFILTQIEIKYSELQALDLREKVEHSFQTALYSRMFRWAATMPPQQLFEFSKSEISTLVGDTLNFWNVLRWITLIQEIQSIQVFEPVLFYCQALCLLHMPFDMVSETSGKLLYDLPPQYIKPWISYWNRMWLTNKLDIKLLPLVQTSFFISSSSSSSPASSSSSSSSTSSSSLACFPSSSSSSSLPPASLFSLSISSNLALLIALLWKNNTLPSTFPFTLLNCNVYENWNRTDVNYNQAFEFETSPPPPPPLLDESSSFQGEVQFKRIALWMRGQRIDHDFSFYFYDMIVAWRNFLKARGDSNVNLLPIAERESLCLVFLKRLSQLPNPTSPSSFLSSEACKIGKSIEAQSPNLWSKVHKSSLERYWVATPEFHSFLHLHPHLSILQSILPTVSKILHQSETKIYPPDLLKMTKQQWGIINLARSKRDPTGKFYRTKQPKLADKFRSNVQKHYWSWIESRVTLEFSAHSKTVCVSGSLLAMLCLEQFSHSTLPTSFHSLFTTLRLDRYFNPYEVLPLWMPLLASSILKFKTPPQTIEALLSTPLVWTPTFFTGSRTMFTLSLFDSSHAVEFWMYQHFPHLAYKRGMEHFWPKHMQYLLFFLLISETSTRTEFEFENSFHPTHLIPQFVDFLKNHPKSTFKEISKFFKLSLVSRSIKIPTLLESLIRERQIIKAEESSTYSIL